MDPATAVPVPGEKKFGCPAVRLQVNDSVANGAGLRMPWNVTHVPGGPALGNRDEDENVRVPTQGEAWTGVGPVIE